MLKFMCGQDTKLSGLSEGISQRQERQIIVVHIHEGIGV